MAAQHVAFNIRNLLKTLKASLIRSAAGWLVAIISIVTVLNSGAVTITWTNTAGGKWSAAANWSPNQVPGQLHMLDSTDDVVITNAGTHTVVLDLGPSPDFWDIRGLTLGAGGGNGVQTRALTNKILYVNPMTIKGGGVLADSRSSFHAVITVENGGQCMALCHCTATRWWLLAAC